MAERPLYTFSELVNTAKTKISLSSSKLTDWNRGSNLLSMVEAMVHFVEYLQLRTNEAFTSFSPSRATGDNLKNRARDYFLEPKEDIAAYGIMEFRRNTPATSQFIIYAGSQVSTQPDVFGNTVDFTLNSDISFASGAVSATGMVTCTSVGTIGNVSAGTITNITSSIPGIDTVTNPSAFGSGADAETDEQLRERISLHVNGLKKANESAIKAAALSVPGVVLVRVDENTPSPGQITVSISNQSGLLDSTQVDAVKNAVEDAAAFGITVNIAVPTISYATISFDVTYDSDNYDKDFIDEIVKTAVFEFVNINPDTILQIDDLIIVIRKVAGISKVKNVKINGVADDLVSNGFSVIRVEDKYNSISVNWTAE